MGVRLVGHRKRLACGLALAVASGLATLLGLEIYLRGTRPGPWIPDAVTLCRPVPDASGLRYELIPDRATKQTLPEYGASPAREVVYTVNAAGYRGELLPPKAPGELRLAIVGDSFVFGSQLNDRDTLPYQLEACLAEGIGDGRVHVANLGVPGYQIRQLLVVMDQRLPALDPDLVILNLYVNDAIATPATYEGEEPDLDPPPLTAAKAWILRLGLTSPAWPPSTRRERLQLAIRKRSALADTIARRLYKYLDASYRTADQVHLWREGGAGWQRIQEGLEQALDLSRRDGYELHVSMYPSLAWIGTEPYPLSDAHRRLAMACRDLGLPFHDIQPVLAGHEPQSLWAHELDQHPNAACNLLVAQYMAGEMLVVLDQ